MKKNRLPLIALVAVLVIGSVAGTFAYFTHAAIFENIFQTKPYSADTYEEFESPPDWTPGAVTDKKVYAKNTGESDVIVRMKIDSEKWISGNNVELSNQYNGVDVAIKNFTNTSDWVAAPDGYYYYQSVLKPNDTTKAFLGSVTFNPEVPNTSVAVDGADKAYGEDGYNESAWSADGKKYLGWTDSYGKLHKSYRSSGNGYDGAKYTLTIKVEILQADKGAFAGVWKDSEGHISGGGASILYGNLAK